VLRSRLSRSDYVNGLVVRGFFTCETLAKEALARTTLPRRNLSNRGYPAMTKYRLARFAIFLGFLGSLLLVFAFHATSTDFVLVTQDNGHSAICVGDTALFVVVAHKTLGMGASCPKGIASDPIAAVYSNCPSCGSWGLRLLIIGFILQFFTMEKPSAYNMTRQQQRALQQGKS
jgi:hypothetical protein